jgi:hypothetical protein
MSFDLANVSDNIFDDWLHGMSDRISGDGLCDERLIELVGQLSEKPLRKHGHDA